MNCYNCDKSQENGGIVCSDICKKEFDIDNEGKIDNINKVYRLIEGGLSPYRQTFYSSMRKLMDAKIQLENQNVNIVFQSTKKYFMDDFVNAYENNLDSTCYDNKRRMICSYCKKLLELDNDEDICKEFWGTNPDEYSTIMFDGCTTLIFCNQECVDKSY
jgi:hypothetical protein